MAVDFQVIFPSSLIQLNSVSVVAGMTPPTLNVVGADFSSVDEVLINGVASPSVVIFSKTKLYAQVPAGLLTSNLTSVTVVSKSLTMTPKSLIQFQIGPTASKVSGILRLVQLFLKVLLTTPGLDIFAPKIGGGALKNLGLSFGVDQGSKIVSDFIISVDTTRRQILALQSRDPSIPKAERLLAATVTAANYNQAESALVVSVSVTSQAGRAATANLTV